MQERKVWREPWKKKKKKKNRLDVLFHYQFVCSCVCVYDVGCFVDVLVGSVGGSRGSNDRI